MQSPLQKMASPKGLTADQYVEMILDKRKLSQDIKDRDERIVRGLDRNMENYDQSLEAIGPRPIDGLKDRGLAVGGAAAGALGGGYIGNAIQDYFSDGTDEEKEENSAGSLVGGVGGGLLGLLLASKFSDHYNVPHKDKLGRAFKQLERSNEDVMRKNRM